MSPLSRSSLRERVDSFLHATGLARLVREPTRDPIVDRQHVGAGGRINHSSDPNHAHVIPYEVEAQTSLDPPQPIAYVNVRAG